MIDGIANESTDAGNFYQFKANFESNDTEVSPYLLNHSVGFGNEAITDTCTYSSGNWNINCNDNCTILNNVNLGNNKIIFINSGTFTLDADITNVGEWQISNGCQIRIQNGHKFA